MERPRRPAIDDTTRGDHSTTADAPGSGSALALTIVAHPDLARVGQRARLPDEGRGQPVAVSRAAPLFAHRGQAEADPLGDDRLSRRPLRVAPLAGGGVTVDPSGTTTPIVHRGQSLSAPALFSEDDLRRGVVIELGSRVALLLHLAAAAGALLGESGEPDPEIGGDSDAIRRVLWEVQSVADTPLPVLLRGETGSGKELVARAVHRQSPRSAGPFVAVNLGALTPTLAVSELFGAERGAFTGAVKKQVGYFDQARGGTLFLDEVGEAPVELQVALLRVLETGEMQTVGAQQPRRADVRIVAATDADLEARVASGAFRAPLLNRLGAYEIRIPPLRERRDDVARLLVRFLREELSQLGEAARLDAADRPWLRASLVARLVDHDWPGNVRQLRNVARQLVIANRGRDRAELTPALASLLGGPSAPAPSPSSAPPTTSVLPQPAPVPDVASLLPAPAAPPPVAPAPARRKPASVTEAELGEALRASRWDLAAAAQRLGISRASMYLLIERYPQHRTGGDLEAEEILRAHRDHGGRLGLMADALRVSERALARRLREMGVPYEAPR